MFSRRKAEDIQEKVESEYDLPITATVDEVHPRGGESEYIVVIGIYDDDFYFDSEHTIDEYAENVDHVNLNTSWERNSGEDPIIFGAIDSGKGWREIDDLFRTLENERKQTV